MKTIGYFLLPLMMVLPGLHAVVNYPFPTNVTYQPGVIKPNINTPAEMAEIVQTFWDEWKVEYLRSVSDAPDQYYVFYNEDEESEPENAVCVSEGQGYGMILAVYMAGYDPQAQTIFNNLLHFYEAFPSSLTESLMGWQQVEEEDGSIAYGPEGGDHSATDGDFDIAYALLLADSQWGSNGPINYRAKAIKLLEEAIEADINPDQFTIKLGDWVTEDDDEYWEATRTSDFMLNHLKNFQAATGDAKWQTVTNKTYSLINELFNNFSPTTGLLPDFIEFIDGAYKPAVPNFLERPEDGFYSWNACRTPWRIATDYILTGDTRALNQLTTLNNWIKTKTSGSPYDTKAGYKLDGTPLSKYDDLAFVTPFAVSAMISSNNQEWLNELWDYTSTQPTVNETYYANSIRLLCFLVISGNWWTPLNLP